MDQTHGFFLFVGLLFICFPIGSLYGSVYGFLSFGGGTIIAVMFSVFLNKIRN